MRAVDVNLPDRRLQGQWVNEAAVPAEAWAPTLVFLHEGLGCIDLWRGFPEALCRATGLRGFAYDRTGSGRSSPWPEAPGVRYLAVEGDRVLPLVLDAMAIGPCLLVGHGDGAIVALHYASSQPPLLRAVVTIGARVVTETRTLATLRQARDEFDKGSFRTLLARYHGDNVDAVFRVWNEAWLSPGFKPMDADGRLPRVRVPVLALQGEDDEYATPVQLATIARRVSGRCEARVVPGCGHAPHLHDQAGTVGLIGRFVATLWRGPGEGARPAVALLLAVTCAMGAAVNVSGQDRGCEAPAVTAALDAAARQLQRLEDREAAATLGERPWPSACLAADVARLAVDGWVEARRLAQVGGDPAALGPVSSLLERLDEAARSGPPTDLDVQVGRYAQAVIRAAVAAAQDERDEMQVYLLHGRDLAESLAAGGVRPWPLTIDEAAGELWLEVDRFEEARPWLERAVATGSTRSVPGLARALERLGEAPAACAAYRRAAALPFGAGMASEVTAAMLRLNCPEG